MLNLTPHPIVVITKAGTITFPPSGKLARISVLIEDCDPIKTEIGDIDVIKRKLLDIEGLPDEGVPCLVSSLVLAVVPGRAGVYAPDTGTSAIRDSNGNITAVRNLIAA